MSIKRLEFEKQSRYIKSGGHGGHRPGAGRPAGAPNRTTSDVKEVLERCFAELGGIGFLRIWAEENPGEFIKIWSKLLPSSIIPAVESDFSLGEELKKARERALNRESA